LASRATSAADFGLAGVAATGGAAGTMGGAADGEGGGNGFVCASAAPTLATSAQDATIKIRILFSSRGER